MSQLQNENIHTELIILEADHKTIHDRILSRGEEEGCWCMENIDFAIAGSASLPGIHIPTTNISVEDLVKIVFAKLGIPCKEQH